MTDHAHELRRYARKIAHPAGDVPAVMLAAADEIERLRAENAALVDDMNLLRNNNVVLRARIAAMEKQEPVAWQSRSRPTWSDGAWSEWSKCSEGYAQDIKNTPLLHDWHYEVRALYLAHGAQPAPSLPEGWLRAIDEALIVAHIGVANESDTYEQAKAKLDRLVGFHVDVATDPAVNGGWKLVPTAESRHPGIYKMLSVQHAPSVPEGWKKELFCIQHAMAMNNWDWESDASDDMKRAAYAAVVRLRAAAPESKP